LLTMFSQVILMNEYDYEFSDRKMHSDKISVDDAGVISIVGEDGFRSYVGSIHSLDDDLIEDIIDHHFDFVFENYPYPVSHLACRVLDNESREWLEQSPNTLGAVHVIETGFVQNELGWFHRIVDQFDRVDDLESEIELIEMYGPQRELAHFVGDSE